MYSGIVQAKRPVKHVDAKPGLISYSVTFTPSLLEGLVPGASVAINGVCMTVTHLEGEVVYFDAIQVTLECTSLRNLEEGELVHVERSLKYGEEVGGHLMSGHVNGTATVDSIFTDAHNCTLVLKVPQEMLAQIHVKGFLGVHGCSLTVQSIDTNTNTLTIGLIPETRRRTIFEDMTQGDLINIELYNPGLS